MAEKNGKIAIHALYRSLFCRGSAATNFQSEQMAASRQTGRSSGVLPTA